MFLMAQRALCASVGMALTGPRPAPSYGVQGLGQSRQWRRGDTSLVSSLNASPSGTYTHHTHTSGSRHPGEIGALTLVVSKYGTHTAHAWPAVHTFPIHGAHTHSHRSRSVLVASHGYSQCSQRSHSSDEPAYVSMVDTMNVVTSVTDVSTSPHPGECERCEYHARSDSVSSVSSVSTFSMAKHVDAAHVVGRR